MLCVRFEIRLAFGDKGEQFILRYWVPSSMRVVNSYQEHVMDTAAMREDLHDSNFSRVRICGKNLSSVSVSLNFPSSDEL